MEMRTNYASREAYSYSDRCRYYWHEPAVQTEIERLLDSLNTHSFPLTLVSQYLPREYEAIRAGQIEQTAEAIIRYHIQLVLRTYAAACGMEKNGLAAPERHSGGRRSKSVAGFFANGFKPNFQLTKPSNARKSNRS